MTRALVPTVEEIMRLVAREYGLPVESLSGRHVFLRLGDIVAEAKRLAEARLLCYWLARRATPMSFPELAARFHRDASTIQKCVRGFEETLAADEDLASTARALLEGITETEATH